MILKGTFRMNHVVPAAQITSTPSGGLSQYELDEAVMFYPIYNFISIPSKFHSITVYEVFFIHIWVLPTFANDLETNGCS